MEQSLYADNMLEVVGFFVFMAGALSIALYGRLEEEHLNDGSLNPNMTEKVDFSIIKDEEVNAYEMKEVSSQGGNTSKTAYVEVHTLAVDEGTIHGLICAAMAT